MIKKIEDFLPFYLGCGVELDNGGSKVYNRILCAVGGVGDGGYNYCNLRTESGLVHGVLLKENRVKLLLRPFSDMTEEEWDGVEQKTSIMPDAWGYHGVRDMFIKPFDSKNRFAWMIVNEALIELRKIGIDVDGLIKSGLAIDKTKISV